MKKTGDQILTWFHLSVRYAIEMKSGWFQENGIVPGMQVKGLDKVQAGR